MKKTLLTLLALAFTGSITVEAGDIYVSPAGNDSADGTALRPLQTPQEAMKRAREWRRLHKKEAEDTIRIHLAKGEYRLTKPLFVRPEDSGTKASPTIIIGSGEGAATVSGGMTVSGWRRGCDDERVPKEMRDKVWTADAPVTGNRILYCRQLWVNGTKAVRAQQGKWGEMTRMTGFNPERRTITIPAPEEDLKSAKQLEMLVHQRWAIAILRVKGIKDLGDGQAEVSFHEPESQLEFAHPWPQPVIDGERGNSSFCLVNAPQLLDTPGEWYQDYPSGKIYYLPREGEDMTTAEAVVPALETIVTVDGTRERTVHDIEFRNIVFAHSSWAKPLYEGHVTLQGGFRMIDAYKLHEPGLPEKASLENQAWIARPDAAVRVNNASGIKFEGCSFVHLGATGLDLEQAVVNSQVSGCTFTDIGGNGMLIGKFPDGGFETHVPYTPKISGDLCRNITIEDNDLSDIANEDWGCNGISAGYVSDTDISHNTLHNLNYSGICVGWGWTPLESGMRNNRINANHIYDFARQLYDVGGIYTLSNQPGSEMRYNCIEDLHAAPYATNDRAFYIYLDEATDGYTVADNWMPDTLHIGYNQPGKSLKVENNGPMVSQSIRQAAGARTRKQASTPQPTAKQRKKNGKK